MKIMWPIVLLVKHDTNTIRIPYCILFLTASYCFKESALFPNFLFIVKSCIMCIVSLGDSAILQVLKIPSPGIGRLYGVYPTAIIFHVLFCWVLLIRLSAFEWNSLYHSYMLEKINIVYKLDTNSAPALSTTLINFRYKGFNCR